MERAVTASKYNDIRSEAVTTSRHYTAEELTNRLLSQFSNNTIYVNVTYL